MKTLRLLPLLLALAALPAQAQAVLSFEALRHDFGTIPEGPLATHTFVFTNTGDAPLTLDAVVPSCGCTAPEFSSDPVAPGARGHVTVAYDTEARPGPFDRTVAVTARAAQPQTVVLRIVGEVVPAFAATGHAQGALVFAADARDAGTLRAGAAAQHAFRFVNRGERPVRVLAVRTGTPGVEAVFPSRPVFAGDVASIVVTAEALPAEGPFEIALEVETDDAQQPVKTLRLSGRVATD
ncbi:MAG: DUF1573 domain-containing protein [Rubricoccaceae bacterium]